MDLGCTRFNLWIWGGHNSTHNDLFPHDPRLTLCSLSGLFPPPLCQFSVPLYKTPFHSRAARGQAHILIFYYFLVSLPLGRPAREYCQKVPERCLPECKSNSLIGKNASIKLLPVL